MKPYKKARVPHIIFGRNTALQAGTELHNLGVTRCLVVTNKGVRAGGSDCRNTGKAADDLSDLR